MRTVAREAQVSVATVSRVLNNNGPVSDLSRQKVLSAANRLGYFTGAERGHEPVSIAMAYAGSPSLQSPFDAALWEGMAQLMDNSAFNLLAINLYRIRREGETFSQAFRRNGIRGAIIRSISSTRAITESLIRDSFPMVVVSDREAQGAVCRIYSDSVSGTEAGIRHLLDLGHRRIAIGVSEMIDSDHQDRLDCYRSCLRNAGIEPEPRLHLSVPPTIEGGVQLMRHLLAMTQRATAVYITDPIVGVGAINLAHEMGVAVPEQFSILGFDDSTTRLHVYPKLTSVCQDTKRLGFESFLLLNAIISGERTEPATQVLPTTLSIHGSTARPPLQIVRYLPDGSSLPDEPVPA